MKRKHIWIQIPADTIVCFSFEQRRKERCVYIFLEKEAIIVKLLRRLQFF